MKSAVVYGINGVIQQINYDQTIPSSRVDL